MTPDPWHWLYEPVDHRPPGAMRPEHIDEYRQNKVRFVIRDAARELGLSPFQAARLARILVARGITKWLRARRRVIALKDEMRMTLGACQAALADGRAHTCGRVQWIRGYARATQEWREQLRRICHSSRWVLGADAEDQAFVETLLRHAPKTELLEHVQLQNAAQQQKIIEVLVAAGFDVRCVHDTLVVGAGPESGDPAPTEDPDRG